MNSAFLSEPSSRGESSPVTPEGSYARLVFQGSDGQSIEKNVLRYTTLIGAAPTCNIQLLDPAISTVHCILTLEAGRLCARDLRSQSGTRLNGHTIQAAVLSDGDRLQVGSFTFDVETNLCGQASDKELDHVPTHTETGEEVVAQLVFSGPNDERLTKNLLRPTTVIGSSRGCNVQLVSNEIAPAHCVVTLEAGYLRLRDLRSQTGSRVNGVSVEVAALSNGDRLDLGTFRFDVETNLPSRPLQTAVAGRMPTVNEASAELDRELQELREERATLQAEQVQLRAEQAHLNARLEQLDQDRRQLEQDRSEAAERASQQDREREELASKQRDLQSQREVHLEEVDALEKTANELQSAQSRLDDDLAQLAAERESLRQSQQEQSERESTYKSDLEAYERDREALESRTAELVSEQEELQRQQSEIEHDRQAIAAERADFEVVVQRHRDVVAEFERDWLIREEQKQADESAEKTRSELHREQTLELERQSHELDEQRKQFQQDLEDLAAQREQIDLQQKRQEAEDAEFIKQREEFERQRSEFASEREQFSAQQSDLIRQQQTTEERESFVGESENALRAERRRLELERESFTREQAELNSLLATLAADRSRLENEQSEQAASRADLQKQLEILQQSRVELDELREQLANEQRELEESRRQHQTTREEISRQAETLKRTREVAEQTVGESDEQRRLLEESRRQFEQEREALQAEQLRIQKMADDHATEERELQQQRERLAADESRLQTERAQFLAAQKGFRLEVSAFEEEFQKHRESQKELALETEATNQERETLQQLRETYEQQQAELEALRQKLQSDAEELNSNQQDLEQERSALSAEGEQLNAERSRIATEQVELNELRDALSHEREALDVEQQRLTEQQQETTTSAEKLADGLETLQREQNAFHEECEQFRRQAMSSVANGNGNGSATEKAENEIVASVTSRPLAGGGIGRAQIEWLLEGRRFRGFFINQYRVVELLGTGSTGWLYEAEDTASGRTLALKVLSAQHVINPAMRKRFELEARSCMGLDHPNIVRTLSLEQCDETQFLVMEVAYGASLQELVELKGPIPPANACDLAMQAAQGLEQIHDSGVIHRDLKPANLLLTHCGQLKIIDFGLALIQNDSDELMLKNDFGHDCMGTADYMPPEQASDSYGVGPTADIYSLGCTLYFALTGELPFPIEPVAAKLKAHRDRQPISLSDLNPDVPLGVSEVVDRMMAKDPADRFQNAAEVVAALRPFAQRAPIYFDFQAILKDRAVTAKKRMFLLANWEMNRPISPSVVDRKAEKASSKQKLAEPELTRP